MIPVDLPAEIFTPLHLRQSNHPRLNAVSLRGRDLGVIAAGPHKQNTQAMMRKALTHTCTRVQATTLNPNNSIRDKCASSSSPEYKPHGALMAFSQLPDGFRHYPTSFVEMELR